MLKSTGIIRRVDELGRVVLPKELRNKLSIDVKDPIEIFIDGRSVVLRKVESSCVFCGKTQTLKDFKGQKICAKCLEELTEK